MNRTKFQLEVCTVVGHDQYVALRMLCLPEGTIVIEANGAVMAATQSVNMMIGINMRMGITASNPSS